MTVRLENDRATRALGDRLMRLLPIGSRVYLSGDLGAGKTTLVQGALAGLGHRGPVPSPTFTLVESYRVGGRQICHCDFYRIGDPEEVELLGIRDYFDGAWDCWVEWAERAQGFLPEPDLEVRFELQGRGRRIVLRAGSEAGRKVVEVFS